VRGEDVIDPRGNFEFISRKAWENTTATLVGGHNEERVVDALLDTDIQIDANYSFGQTLAGPLTQWRSYMRPVKYLRKRIDRELLRMRPYQMIGVCIRCGKNAVDKQMMTKPQWFAERISNIITENERDDIRFWVVADNILMHRSLMELYPKHMMSLERPVFNRNSMLAEQCIINMYLLSHTKYILGSNWSSFARMPAVLAPGLHVETHVVPAMPIPFDDKVES